MGKSLPNEDEFQRSNSLSPVNQQGEIQVHNTFGNIAISENQESKEEEIMFAASQF